MSEALWSFVPYRGNWRTAVETAWVACGIYPDIPMLGFSSKAWIWRPIPYFQVST